MRANNGFVTLWAALLVVAVPVALGDGPGHEHPFETYVQHVTIRFTDARSAADAEVSVAPLPGGHHRAVSCRWDDNVTSANERTRDLMERYGIHGTFYLNGRHFSPTNGEVDYLETAAKLPAGGNSIGGHSLTHPFITYYHPNRMFEEMAAVRIEWESNLDVPVFSYAYSFIDLLPGPRGVEAQAETVRSLERAGFYHVAEYLSMLDGLEPGLEISPIMPPENHSFDEFKRGVEWAYNDSLVVPAHPMISNSMHAWYGTPMLDKGFDALEQRFQLLAGLENVWHCNQNEYGAYRRQVRASKLGDFDREENRLSFTIHRPRLESLGDPVPLTLVVSGIAPESIEAVQTGEGDVLRVEADAGTVARFELGHGGAQCLPSKIGHVPNPENRQEMSEADRDLDHPDIFGLLTWKEEALELCVRSKESLRDLRLTWRMPLGWHEGLRGQRVEKVEAGDPVVWKLPITRNPGGRPSVGAPYFVAQLDFTSGGERGRLHFTCRGQCGEAGASWPREGFSLLGPIGESDFDPEAIDEAIKETGLLGGWELSSGELVSWRTNPRDGYIRQEWIDPEYVRTMGTWDPNSPGYLLRSHVDSPDSREFIALAQQDHVAAMYVNGERLEDFTGRLKEGRNDLLIVYRPQQLNRSDRRLAACFVRLCRPGSRERMEDIRFTPWRASGLKPIHER